MQSTRGSRESTFIGRESTRASDSISVSMQAESCVKKGDRGSDCLGQSSAWLNNLPDTSEYRFIPPVTKKYHALVALPETLRTSWEFKLGDGLEHVSPESELPNPYTKELDALTFSANELKEIPLKPLGVVEFVNTSSKLQSCIQQLRKVSEVGVAVQYLSAQTYFGRISAIAFSTEHQEFFVDTTAIADVYKLGKILADPRIVKVMHDADHAVLALQREFGLYVVKLFDTAVAASVLNCSETCLAFLLRERCGFVLDSITGASQEAGSPLFCNHSHYLLSLASSLKKSLVRRAVEEQKPEHSVILKVFERSKEISRLVFCKKKEEFPEVTGTMRKLLKFRDILARLDNVNPETIISTASLMELGSCQAITRSQLTAAFQSDFVEQYEEYLLTILGNPRLEQTRNSPYNKQGASKPRLSFFDSPKEFGPEIFEEVLRTQDEVTIGISIISTIQRVANPHYLAKIPQTEVTEIQDQTVDLQTSRTQRRSQNKENRRIEANSPKPAFRSLFK